MKQIIKRLKAETPVFFTRVKYFGASLGVAGAGIIQIKDIPEWLHYYAGQAIWVGAVMAVIAQLTCSKPEDLK